MDKRKFSDRGYKALFSFPETVEALIRLVAQEDLVRELDFSTLKRTGHAFVTDRFTARESDVLWEMSLRGQPAYFFILLELQSTVDPDMSLRVLDYILLLYADLRKRQPDSALLPPVFPIVVYNGSRKWTAACRLEDLIHVPFPGFRPFVPHFNYSLVAINEFSHAGRDEIHDLLEAVFLLENSDLEHLPAVIARIIPVIAREANPRLQRVFRLWMLRYLQKAGVKQLPVRIEEEAKKMLETTIDEFKERMILQGQEQGIERGRRQQALEMMLDLLTERFGEVPPTLRARLEALPLESLTRLSRRVVRVESLDALAAEAEPQ